MLAWTKLMGERVYKQILVPVDGSSFAEEVIPTARQLASMLGATLTLLYVAEKRSKVASAEKYLRTLAERHRAASHVVVQRGAIAKQIVAAAQWVPGTLIAISARGRSGLATAMLGSVARELVQSSGAPVLVFKPRGRGDPLHVVHPFASVLLPLDGSAASECVRDRAARFAKALSAELVALRVVEADEGAHAITADEAADYLDGHAAEVAEKFGVRVRTQVLHGDPVDALTLFLRHRRDVLVVMGTRSQSALRAAVQGSVTSGLMHEVSAPVVVQVG